MAFTQEGKLYKKFETVQVTDTFKKKEFILEVEDGQYTQLIKFELTQDNVSKIDDVKEGDKIAVRFNLRGREYTKDGNTMYFNTLQAWKIEHGATVEASATEEGATLPTDDGSEDGASDDTPF